MPEEHLTRFNGIQSTAQSLTMFAAPMAAGALLTFVPNFFVYLAIMVFCGCTMPLYNSFILFGRKELVKIG